MRLLVLTDYRDHTRHNSLYSICRALHKYEVFDQIDVCNRSYASNHAFFYEMTAEQISVHALDETFSFPVNIPEEDLRKANLSAYDFILLRLPRPIPAGFFEFLERQFPPQHIINKPSGIKITGSKDFLLNFTDFIPVSRICRNFEDIERFAAERACVLKPFENYGGRGIIKIAGGMVEMDGEQMPMHAFRKIYESQPIPYLAMEYQKNVDQGDKRLVVVDGEIFSATIRMPAPGGWLCNVAQGGRAEVSEPTGHEKYIVSSISPILRAHGIFMYGLDTLMGNHGERVISEINTLSSGGIHEVIGDTDSAEAKRFAGLFKKYISDIIDGEKTHR